MSVRLLDALAINGRNGWLVGGNLLDEPHRSAAQPQDRQHNARPLPTLEADPPHDDNLASQRSFLYLYLRGSGLVPGPYIELFARRRRQGWGCLGKSGRRNGRRLWKERVKPSGYGMMA